MCEATAECGKIQLRPRKALLDKLWAIHLKNQTKARTIFNFTFIPNDNRNVLMLLLTVKNCSNSANTTSALSQPRLSIIWACKLPLSWLLIQKLTVFGVV